MIPDHPDEAPEPTPTPSEAPTSAPASRRMLWPWLVLAGCVIAGLAVGASLGLRGGSLFPSQPQAGTARPTIVVARSPSPSPVTRTPAAPTSPVVGQYVVETGDTMRGVAQKVYGDADLWPRIYEANRDVVGPDPDALQVGMRLRIPAS